MAVRIAIRDDDTCFFTRPEELEAVYAPLGEWLPVSLAVTPFAVEAFHLGDPVRFFLGWHIGQADIARAVSEQNHQGHDIRVRVGFLPEHFQGQEQTSGQRCLAPYGNIRQGFFRQLD